MSIGRLNEQRGYDNECLVVNAFALAPDDKPWWLKSIRHATAEEDHNGIDAVATVTMQHLRAEVDVGFQIKSSRIGAERFLEKHPAIKVLVVKDGTTSANIRQKIMCLLCNERKATNTEQRIY